MSDKKAAPVLKKCQKCEVDMNGDMLDAQGMCPRCKILIAEEQKKNQQTRSDCGVYDTDEAMDEPAFADFISCNRTGRRNAVLDLQGDANRIKLEKLAGTIDEISISEESQEESEEAKKEPEAKAKKPETKDKKPETKAKTQDNCPDP